MNGPTDEDEDNKGGDGEKKDKKKGRKEPKGSWNRITIFDPWLQVAPRHVHRFKKAAHVTALFLRLWQR